VTSTWIVVALFVVLFGIGLAVTLGGLYVVARSLMAQKPARAVPAPRPAPKALPKPPPLVPQELKPTEVADEWSDEVPTAVFKPSDFKDIEALMREADKYVSKHKGDT
jgi:hypothetical protein